MIYIYDKWGLASLRNFIKYLDWTVSGSLSTYDIT